MKYNIFPVSSVNVSDWKEEYPGAHRLYALVSELPSMEMFGRLLLSISLVRGEEEWGEIIVHPKVTEKQDGLVAVVSQHKGKIRGILTNVSPASNTTPTIQGDEEKIKDIVASALQWAQKQPREYASLRDMTERLATIGYSLTFREASNWLGICYLPPAALHQEHYILVVGEQVVGEAKEKPLVYNAAESDVYVYVSGNVDDSDYLFRYCADKWKWQIVAHNPDSGAMKVITPSRMFLGKDHLPYGVIKSKVVAVFREGAA